MTTSSFLEFEDQATGANNNTWGDVADANFAIFELAIARVLGLNTTGGSTTLSSSQNRYPIINVTGVLASNATVVVKTQEKNFIIINNTTGAFTVTVKTAAGTGKTVPRGRALNVYCDGTNVLLAREQAIPAAQAGGTVDVITATFEPAFIAAEIQDGTMWLVEASGANTSTTPTFNPDATGALTIKKNGAQALVAGDIPRIGYKMLLAYDASGGHVELLNPNIAALVAASTTEVLTGTDTAKYVTADALAAIWEKGSDIASAATLSLGEGGYFRVTGTTGITDIDFATAKDGRRAWLYFEGACLLTHNATTMALPGAANYTTSAGDMAFVVQDNSDNVKVLIFKADGTAVVASGWTTLFKAADENRTNTTVLAADATLTFAMTAGTYVIRGVHYQEQTDGKLSITGPSGTGSCSARITNGGGADQFSYNTNTIITASTTYQASINTSSTGTAAFYFEIRITVSGSGTFAVNFAQQSNSGTPTVGMPGSYVEYKKVA